MNLEAVLFAALLTLGVPEDAVESVTTTRNGAAEVSTHGITRCSMATGTCTIVIGTRYGYAAAKDTARHEACHVAQFRAAIEAGEHPVMDHGAGFAACMQTVKRA